ncbi:MAG: DinB family protein [bacterium]
MSFRRPASSEYAPHQAAYIDLVPDGDIVLLLRQNEKAVDAAFGSVDERRAGYRYARDKWSVRAVLGHLIDAERILFYRALRIVRGDATPLARYDADAFVSQVETDRPSLISLRAEWWTVRQSAIRLYASLPEEAWTRTGIIDGTRISVRAVAYVCVGHAIHHLQGLADRYGVQPDAPSTH